MKIYLLNNPQRIPEVVETHMQTFPGFFLTFMGKGFLSCLYNGFCRHKDSNLIVAEEKGKIVGFLAYSYKLSAFYKFLIRTRLPAFAWYSFLAFLRSPKVFFKLIKALFKPNEVKNDEEYIALSSIGVLPECKHSGIGMQMTQFLKKETVGKGYPYIQLETDAVDNTAANHFYKKNGFICVRTFMADGRRKMNLYRYSFTVQGTERKLAAKK